MSFLSFFSKKAKLKDMIDRVIMECYPKAYTDEFYNKCLFFSNLFYTHGFLYSMNKPPAFLDSYKNINEEKFKSTYISLPVFYTLKTEIGGNANKSLDEVFNAIEDIYSILDLNIFKIITKEWRNIPENKLDDQLFFHFDKYNIFEKVFINKHETQRWFKDFLNQSVNYTNSQIF